MKKILRIFIMVFSLFLVNVDAKECDLSNIRITSIELNDKSEYTEELSRATVDNKKINFDLKMFDVGDYAEYKIKVDNSSGEDFYFDEKSLNIDSDYFKYSISSKNNSNIVKANNKMVFLLKVEYKKKVEKEKYFNGSFIDNSKVKILVSDNKKSILTNPLTESNKIIFILILILIIAIIIFRQKNEIRLFIILGGSILIPLNTYALCNINLVINSNITIGKVKPNPCTYDGELVQGAEYVNGQYTYTYKPVHKTCTSSWNGSSWISNCTETELGDGWGIVLTDKNSTDPVTTKMCTSINNKPIVSMENTFSLAKSSVIDLSSFDTSNVVSMYQMFMAGWNNDKQFDDFDLSSFDTSKVENMDYMFENLKLDVLNLTSFDMSNVKTIGSMFTNSKINNLDMHGIDLSNVINADYSFEYLECDNLDLSDVKTEKLESMNTTFGFSKIKKVDLSSFNKTNLKNLHQLFMYYEGEEVILNGMDTSKVTDMEFLFQNAKLDKIDLRNIDTSNVNTMYDAFERTKANEILFPDYFSFAENAKLSYMFEHTEVPIIDLSGMDTSNVGNMYHMFLAVTAKEIVLSNKFSNERISNSSSIYSLFDNVNVKSLDLSGLNTSIIQGTPAILYNVTVDTIYVKSEEDAEWLRNYGTYNSDVTNYVVK